MFKKNLNSMLSTKTKIKISVQLQNASKWHSSGKLRFQHPGQRIE